MSGTNRAQVNKDKTIEDIKMAFIHLYGKTSLNQITVKEICEAAGVSRTIFYRYFDDKYAVLESLENDMIQKIDEFNALAKAKDLETYLLRLMTWTYENQFFLKPLFEQQESSRIPTHWKKNVQKGLLSFLNVDKGKVEYLDHKLTYAVSGYIGLYTDWIYKHSDTPPEEMARIMVELLRKSVL